MSLVLVRADVEGPALGAHRPDVIDGRRVWIGDAGVDGRAGSLQREVPAGDVDELRVRHLAVNVIPLCLPLGQSNILTFVIVDDRVPIRRVEQIVIDFGCGRVRGLDAQSDAVRFQVADDVVFDDGIRRVFDRDISPFAADKGVVENIWP